MSKISFSNINFKNKFFRISLHILFWIIVLISIANSTNKDYFLSFSFITESINLLFYVFIVYFNIYYLFPKYLKGKSLKIYVPVLILTVLLITPIKGAVLYLIHYNNEFTKKQILYNLHYTFLTTFFIAGTSTVLKILTEWVKYQREKKKLEKEKLHSELKFLKSQINPHFLFNTLNNLYSLALVKSDKTPDIILKLSEILRYMLYECNVPKVSLIKEVNYIQNYLALERLRQRDDVKIEFNMEGDISDQKISPLLFTPFLENAFKHGVNKVIEGAFVNIQLIVKDNKVFFAVENIKPEFTHEDFQKKQGGIGLANVKKRLKLLYPEKYKLDIENTKFHYKIELYLDLNNKK